MEIDIIFDTYIVSNAENEFCQKEKPQLIKVMAYFLSLKVGQENQ